MPENMLNFIFKTKRNERTYLVYLKCGKYHKTKMHVIKLSIYLKENLEYQIKLISVINSSVREYFENVKT